MICFTIDPVMFLCHMRLLRFQSNIDLACDLVKKDDKGYLLKGWLRFGSNE